MLMRFFSLLLTCVFPLLVGCDTNDRIAKQENSEIDSPVASIDDALNNGTANHINGPVIDSADELAAKLALDQLKTEFENTVVRLRHAIEAAKTDVEKKQIFESQNPGPALIDGLIHLAKDYSQTQTAVTAALEAVSRSKGNEKDRAMNFLIENFATKLRYANMIKSFQDEVPSLQIEAWMKNMIEFAPEGPSEARAILGLAKYIDQIPAYRIGFLKNPHLLAKLPEAQQKYLTTVRTDQQKSELAAMLQTVVGNYPNDKYERDQTYSDVARVALFELQHLSIGQTVPEIIAKDLDGVEFKLSDYRGKVVMLDFWGHWCPPCRKMYPQERELVSKLAGKPFALIGMNSDRSLEIARDAVRDEGLPWRHFWNGPLGTSGPIAEQWNIEAWPTVYLIDGDGIIRYKDILGDDLDRALELLMSEIDHEVDLSELGGP